MKFFKFLEAVGNHAAGAIVEMDDADPAVKKYLAAGIIAEAPSAEDAIVAKAVDVLSDKIAKAITPAVEKAMDAVTQTVSKGVRGRIDAGEQEADRTKSFGDWLKHVGAIASNDIDHIQLRKAAERLEKVYGSHFRQWDTKASGVMQEGTGPSGGYVTPPEYSNNIWKIAIEQTILGSRAKRLPMVSNTLYYPKLDQTSTASAGTLSGYLAGVQAVWTKETVTSNQTRAAIKQGILEANELRGYTEVTNELLQDNAVGMEAILSDLFAQAIAYFSDLAFLVGDGVGKPKGVLNSPCSISVTRNASTTFKYVDAVTMESKLLAESAERSFWVMHPTVKPQLYQFADGSSRNIWLPNVPAAPYGPAGTMPPAQLLNHPIYFSEKVSALGTAGDVMLIDPLGYIIGDRMALEIAASPHVQFLKNETVYRFMARVAGQSLLDLPFTLLDGTNQLSTFAYLT